MDATFRLGEIKFIHIMLHYGKVIVIASDVFVAITINIHNKISFNLECFKNTFPFFSIPFTIRGSQLKVAGYLKKL